MAIQEHVERLIRYGLQKELISLLDIEYIRNRLYEALHITHPEPADCKENEPLKPLPELLNPIYEWAAKTGRMADDTDTYRDLLSAKLMGCFAPPPSEIVRRLEETKAVRGSRQATRAFYQFAEDIYYIRSDRMKQNIGWKADTAYGKLEMTINLSKPEKDPKAIAAAKENPQSQYPRCVLCKENVGYEGRPDHPARQNLRVIPVILGDEQWFLQFSPYVYYREHCIVLKDRHEPMQISKKTFDRLLSFVSQYPHYFLGSNADLPIVGGSILSHDHFQGGEHDFPMAQAETESCYKLRDYPQVTMGIVKWPLSVLRLQGGSAAELSGAADYILRAWRGYSDEAADIIAYTGETPHNTITPIARRKNGLFELDLVLRNNRTSDEHPSGIFHPHQEVHHLKKENIGLIEVMGLAILPGRLEHEMRETAEALCSPDPEAALASHSSTAKHKEWALSVLQKRTVTKENAGRVLKEEIGHIFAQILEHAGVFKQTADGRAAFRRFISRLDAIPEKSLIP
ncbi:UDP-glucose--hexose-1-phosphate uridylyltransferase [Bacillus nakamurai]|uniref:UDP-glucose--hexose-1-phosphate uridylyltransferase n=1 Tax=Bacillus nakamurai TaxID=1793963 RepID=UPI0020C3A683|nr:UDP-glucose--hexose-1-phosphate uridylyltransferase [Bacillus nakamurai]MCP6680816.1 UDP-glucose--hexose-1-phosphate uridylyltransferase [Bacillus nakamurai]